VNTYIALFRGINVGGRNILPMNELTEVFEALGHKNIQTYIQSGNVVFQSICKLGKKDVSDLSSGVLERKGFEPNVLLLSEKQLLDAIRNNPFSTSSGKALHLFFYEPLTAEPATERLQALKADSEDFKLTDSVFYLHAPDGVGRSKLAASAERSIGAPVTARNWNTVSKLASMVGSLRSD